jgi:hypothetical protein
MMKEGPRACFALSHRTPVHMNRTTLSHTHLLHEILLGHGLEHSLLAGLRNLAAHNQLIKDVVCLSVDVERKSTQRPSRS